LSFLLSGNKWSQVYLAVSIALLFQTAPSRMARGFVPMKILQKYEDLVEQQAVCNACLKNIGL
jgi:hypothetical protein